MYRFSCYSIKKFFFNFYLTTKINTHDIALASVRFGKTINIVFSHFKLYQFVHNGRFNTKSNVKFTKFASLDRLTTLLTMSWPFKIPGGVDAHSARERKQNKTVLLRSGNYSFSTNFQAGAENIGTDKQKIEQYPAKILTQKRTCRAVHLHNIHLDTEWYRRRGALCPILPK